MSYPILYNSNETNFDNNGIGILSDCVSCEVVEEANGMFELSMKYPMDGIHFYGITTRSIIKAKIDEYRSPQLFRVYSISKPMIGIVTVLAAHISYDLSDIPIPAFYAGSVQQAFNTFVRDSVVPCPFGFLTDNDESVEIKSDVPSSIRSRLGGSEGSILDVVGGEYEFDNYTVNLHKQRGQDRGFSIRYGKNLVDIQQDQNCANVATGVYPYWYGDPGEIGTALVELPEKVVNAPGTYDFSKIRVVDFSGDFETPPTEEQLRDVTTKYIKNNQIGVPAVSISISFVKLSQSKEYESLAMFEQVGLFDVVHVEFPLLGVSASAKVVKMVHDIILEKVKSITIGSVRQNLADTIAGYGETISAEVQPR